MWFWFGFGGMGLGSIIILSMLSKFRAQHRYHVGLAVAVTSIATVAYYALARDQATATIGGGVMYYGRYLDWLITTPLLLLSLLAIALPSITDTKQIRQRIGLVSAVVFADIMMIVTGAFADLSTKTFDVTVWYIASCLWFLVIAYLMYGSVKRQAYANSQKMGDIYSQLLLFLSAVWVLYPIVWVLGSTGYQIIDINVEAGAYAIMDVTAKAVFGILTLYMLTKTDKSVKA